MMTPVGEAIWKEVEEDLRTRFGKDSAIDRWLEMIRFLGHDSQALCLGVPNRFVLEWFEKKYLVGLKEILRRRCGLVVDVRLKVDGTLFQELRRTQERVLGRGRGDGLRNGEEIRGVDRVVPDAVESDTDRGTLYQNVRRGEVGTALRNAGRENTPERRQRGRFQTLQSFVVGRSNRAAYEAARQILDSSERLFNPFFVFGSTGLGKTHLLQGIYSEFLRRNAGLRMRYVSGERFLNSFVLSLKDGTITRFREKLRTLDVLFLDDVHHLTHKTKTLEELLHTLEALVNSGSQVIIASSQHPRSLAEKPALVSRLLSGLVVPVAKPDYGTRLEILRRHVQKCGESISDELLNSIAQRVRGNARELLGALNQIRAYSHLSSVSGVQLDPRQVDNVVTEVFHESRRRLRIDDVATSVSEFYGVSISILRSVRRDRTVARARHVAMYLCRRYTHHSLSEIGIFFGNRNASTVRSAEHRVRDLLDKDSTVRRDVSELRDAVFGPS